MEVEKNRRTEYSSLQMTRRRELGQTFQNDTLSSKYYKYIQIKSSWTNDKSSTDHGGIFNLKFSPSGKMLAAACEKATILILDPVSRKLIHRVEKAHCDSVNCICFLDERTFASGSDDSNIILWDARMLREHVAKLEGHTRWVKSVQYDRISRHLVTSAFDDTVRIWDINRYSHGQPKSNIIYRAKHLIRMHLSTACDKLIVSTFGSTLTVFHNLDLENFQQDMNKRELLSHLNNGKDSPKLLSLDRNEPETIMEFPHPPWCVSSLQVHPQGWCLLSRYSSDHRQDEYSTIHDIQTVPHDQLKPTRTTINVKRLSHYIRESTEAQGFIKEQDFSKDGRVIASPFGYGTRLLAFSADCSELCKCEQDSLATKELQEINYLLSHRQAVCISKFSPTHMLVVTGCLGGQIVFHEPKLS